MLRGKKILLGITGSIAAYKSINLLRLLVKEKAEVRVVLSPAALDFVTSLTLSTLSGHPVEHALINRDEVDSWTNHVEIGTWTDFMIIAPCTANTLSKLASGACDNLLTAAYLSLACPVYVAPAMDLDMYKHPTTQQNLKKIQANNNLVIDATIGELASGLHGKGRMAEPEEILDFILKDIKKHSPLQRKKMLVTAGPTFEPIDAVRFIGNQSSGKMGFAIAEEAAILGAEVILISGPSHCELNHPKVKIIKVVTTEEMYNATLKYFKTTNITVMAAAVSDFKPTVVATNKIKKETSLTNIEVEPTIDILFELGKIKKDQYLMGFALETDNAIENAKSKLKRKNADAIVLNSLENNDAGFNVDTNKIVIIDKSNQLREFALKSKKEVASDIINYIVKCLK